MNMRIVKACLVVMLAVQVAGMTPARAGGPLYVTGVASTNPGQPYHWNINPVTYKTDLGSLGNQSNAQANAMIASGFQVWQGVSTANISFQSSGQLSSDVTAANILSFMNSIGNCSSSSQPVNSIVYDVDGSIMTALGNDNNAIIGFAGAVCTDDENGYFTRGWSVLNGRFIDGQPNTPSHSTIPLDEFQAAMVHEFGHLAGLDHSQINLNCLTDQPCSADDLAGLPTMFPVLIDVSQGTPKTDDKAALSLLYPAAGFSGTTGRIQGHVLFSDGETPAQGYNVIARLVTDPRRTAASSVSGFLYTAGAGNLLVPSFVAPPLFYGSHDQSLIGYYDIAGLPPGEYTIEVEAINDSGNSPFVGDSSVGPIGAFLGFQYKMPGTCELQYLNFPSSPNDSCSDKTTVNVGAGMVVKTNTDVIFLGTAPRYDAWEDGP